MQIVLSMRVSADHPHPALLPRCWTVWCRQKRWYKLPEANRPRTPMYLVMVVAETAEAATEIARKKGHFVAEVVP